MRKARGLKRAVRAKTDKEFKDEIYRLVGDEYTFLEPYIKAHTKVKVRHNTCGNEYKVYPNSFTSKGSRCPNCSSTARKTTGKVRQEIYDVVGDEYTMLGEYVHSDVNIKIRHNKCGYEYPIRVRSFVNLGRRCPKCEGTLKHIKGKTTEEFKKEVYREVGDEYVVLGEYTNNYTKINLYHTVCEKEYWVTPNDFVSKGSRCGNCTPSRQLKTLEEFKEEVYSLVGEEYTVVGDYVNTRTNIKMRHNKCGTIWEVRPDNFNTGTRCARCRESKGERNISMYLEQQNITYVREKEFPDLVNDKPLRFDFYLPEHNLLIEYDGIQHFEYVPYFGTYEAYEKQLERDELKNTYCKENNIPLLRIPYTELGNEPDIIKEFIHKLETTSDTYKKELLEVI